MSGYNRFRPGVGVRLAWILCASFLLVLRGSSWAHEGEGEDALEAGEESEHEQENEQKGGHGHDARALGVWKGFLSHLRATGHEDLIPEAWRGAALESEEAAEEEAAGDVKGARELENSDPICGILFRLSPDLVNLDALFREADGRPLGAAEREKATALAARLRAAGDPYLAAYGELFGARLDLEGGEPAKAVAPLEKLKESRHFLPRREAQRLLAGAYRGAGDPTLAVLELQLLLVSLPPDEETARAWAKEELRQIRASHYDREDGGPLAETGERMRGIATSLKEVETGERTQKEEGRVEDVLFKVAQLLEASRCPSCGTPYCQDCGRKRCSCTLLPGKPCSGNGSCLVPGSQAGMARGEKKGNGRNPRGSEKGEAAEDTKFPDGEAAAANLRKDRPEDKEAWGQVNDREVARSLRELWDKIPASYRSMVIQYFRDINDVGGESAPDKK